MHFRTHTGEHVTGPRLQTALETVADWYRENALAIRREDAYAEHVTEKDKKRYLTAQLLFAERVRAGTAPLSFALWQRINKELTGECVAFLG